MRKLHIEWICARTVVMWYTSHIVIVCW